VSNGLRRLPVVSTLVLGMFAACGCQQDPHVSWVGTYRLLQEDGRPAPANLGRTRVSADSAFTVGQSAVVLPEDRWVDSSLGYQTDRRCWMPSEVVLDWGDRAWIRYRWSEGLGRWRDSLFATWKLDVPGPRDSIMLSVCWQDVSMKCIEPRTPYGEGVGWSSARISLVHRDTLQATGGRLMLPFGCSSVGRPHRFVWVRRPIR